MQNYAFLHTLTLYYYTQLDLGREMNSTLIDKLS